MAKVQAFTPYPILSEMAKELTQYMDHGSRTPRQQFAHDSELKHMTTGVFSLSCTNPS